MFLTSKKYLFFLGLVILISLAWSFIVWGLENDSSNLINGKGFGVSLDSIIQTFLLSSYPKIFVVLNVLCFPVLGFVLAYSIFSKFLTQTWSIFLALIFFSNIYGYPFHEFIFEVEDLFEVKNDEMLIKYSTFSVVLSLICVYLVLLPSFIYKNNNYLLMITTFVLVFFNALDAMAITIVYCFSAFLRLTKQRLFFKEATMVLPLILAWLINFYFGVTNYEIVTDAKNSLNYLNLYFFMPIFITLLSFFFLKVDSYQLIRRFSVLGIVMVSEILILLVHQIGIFRFSILELQFLSVYNIFHILYYVPFIFWICNSRDIIMINKNILSFSPHNFVTTYIPLFGIILSVVFNFKLIFIGYKML